jgi:hypothetical protein
MGDDAGHHLLGAVYIFLKCCCSVLLLFACTVVDLMAQYSAEYLLFIFYVTISHLLYLCTFNSTMYKITIFNSTDYRLGCEVLHIRLQNNVKKTCMGWKLWWGPSLNGGMGQPNLRKKSKIKNGSRWMGWPNKWAWPIISLHVEVLELVTLNLIS